MLVPKTASLLWTRDLENERPQWHCMVWYGIHYLRMSSDKERKGIVSHVYVFWKESSNIYYLWKVEAINCKCIFFHLYIFSIGSSNYHTFMYFQVSFQISIILESLWALIIRLWFLNCMYYQMSLQIFISEKAFGHWLQGSGLSLVCVLKCLFKYALFENVFGHRTLRVWFWKVSSNIYSL